LSPDRRLTHGFSVCTSLAAPYLESVVAVDNWGDTVFTALSPNPGDVVYEDGIPVAWASTDIAVLEIFGLPTPTALPSSTPVPKTSGGGGSRQGGPTQTNASPWSTEGIVSSSGAPVTIITLDPTPTAVVGATGAAWNGTGPLLTGTCSTEEWTLMDVSTAFLWAPVVGCVQDKPDCCPFSVAAVAGGDALIQRRASTTHTGAPSGPFPTASGAASAEQIGQCPQDYTSVSGGCCPRYAMPFHPS
jgi:hypothetical protein